MAAIHKVVLVRVDSVYRARPAYMVAEPGDKVRFINLTEATVELTFPLALFPLTTIAIGGVVEKVVPNIGTPTDAKAVRHPYNGSVNGVPAVLQGESSPEIIIDRFTLSPA